jgi:hypothetical protein
MPNTPDSGRLEDVTEQGLGRDKTGSSNIPGRDNHILGCESEIDARVSKMAKNRSTR